MTIEIEWADDKKCERCKKSFKDETAAMEYCRRHYKNINSINGYMTWCEPVDHFTLMDYFHKEIYR